jgi:DnaJ-class molecular chaperone
MARDYYRILGVSRSADEKEIKSAYRRLARQNHPDVNRNNPEAAARFQEISEAYRVLSDPEKRKLYDQYGENYEQVENMRGQGAGYGPFGRGGPGGPRAEGNFDFGGQGEGFETIFEHLFGQMGGNAGPFGRTRARGAPPRDVERPVEVTLEEIDTGTERTLSYQVPNANKGGTESRRVSVKIPQGVSDGKKLRVAGKGAVGATGRAGDLFVVIREAKHPQFKRIEADLETTVELPFHLAALGGEIEVPTLRGKVKMKIPAGTQSNQVFRLSGQGISDLKGKKSDLRVRTKISVPKKLNRKQQKLVKELADSLEGGR